MDEMTKVINGSESDEAKLVATIKGIILCYLDGYLSDEEAMKGIINEVNFYEVKKV